MTSNQLQALDDCFESFPDIRKSTVQRIFELGIKLGKEEKQTDNLIQSHPEERCCTNEDWYTYLDQPCKSMWTDFGSPMCLKTSLGICFLGFKDPKEQVDRCPENRKLKGS